MKSLIIFCTFLIIPGLFSSSLDTSKKIIGTYDLYNEADLKPSGQLEIFNPHEDMFSVRGVGQSWAGVGKFNGKNGIYEWQFASGEKGNTTIELISDGKIKGHVNGTGPGLNWHYIGVRQ